MPTVSPEDLMQLVYDGVNKAIRMAPVPGAIELGAVELKDPDSELRVKVKPDGTDNAAVVTANALPLPAGAATESKQDALVALVTPGTPEHKNGTAVASPAEITFSGPTKYVLVQSSNDKLEVSFDGGTTYLGFLDKGEIGLPCRVTRLHVRSSGGDVDYNIVATV